MNKYILFIFAVDFPQIKAQILNQVQIRILQYLDQNGITCRQILFLDFTELV